MTAKLSRATIELISQAGFTQRVIRYLADATRSLQDRKRDFISTDFFQVTIDNATYNTVVIVDMLPSRRAIFCTARVPVGDGWMYFAVTQINTDHWRPSTHLIRADRAEPSTSELVRLLD